MLDIEHVTKVFFPGTVNEKVALENINLHVNSGDVICVIGSNGSGKSTLFNMIAGTFPVTSGTIKLDGKDITNAPEYKRAFMIGRIFQDPTKGTSANMSVEDNMNLASSKGMKGLRFGLTKERRKYFQGLLESIGLDDRMSDNVGLLSGVRSNMDLQITVARGRVGTTFIRARKTMNFRLFKNTIHRRGLHSILLATSKDILLSRPVLILYSCTRSIIHKKEKAGNNHQLLLCCRVQGGKFANQHLILLLIGRNGRLNLF